MLRGIVRLDKRAYSREARSRLAVSLDTTVVLLRWCVFVASDSTAALCCFKPLDALPDACLLDDTPPSRRLEAPRASCPSIRLVLPHDCPVPLVSPSRTNAATQSFSSSDSTLTQSPIIVSARP